MSKPSSTMNSVRILILCVVAGLVAVAIGGNAGGIVFLIAVVVGLVMLLSIGWDLTLGRRGRDPE